MTQRSSVGASAAALVFACLFWLPAAATNIPKYRLRTRPIPLDSREDLNRHKSGFGREVRFSTAASIPTPGVSIGTTYYEYQHNASTGRQVDEDNGKVQATWMKAPGPSASIRTVNWNRVSVASSPMDFTLANGNVIRRLPFFPSLLCCVEPFSAVRTGYTNFRNRPGGKGVAIYHDAPESGGIKFWEARLDLSAGNGVFGGPSTAPLPPSDYHGFDAPIWPKQAISTCGADIIHHAIGTWSGGSNEVWYWRGIVNDGAGTISWASMPGGLPIKLDPVSTGISAVIEAQGETVIIAMAKNVNSTNADLVYYQSTDCGLSWGPMVNVTGFTAMDPEGLWDEIGAVFDDDGEIHFIFNTTPADGYMNPSKLYHWSPSTGARLITSASWGPWGPCIACPASAIGDVALAEPNLSVKPAGVQASLKN